MRTSQRPPAGAPKRRVLAVDDTPSNLVALDAVLGTDYELVLAKSGQEAIDILAHDHRIDVILMDLAMPIMSGYEAAEHIQKMPGCVEIPLIFISAVFNQDPEIKRGYEVGAVDYFTKPFDPDILRMKVEVYATFRHRTQVLKERERQLRESEEVLRAGRKLSSVLADLPAGVIIADREGRICQTNEHMLRILESASALENEAYGEILQWWEHEAKAIKEDSALSRALATGEASHNVEVAIPCLDGTTKNVLQSTSPLRSLDGAIVGAVVVVQDLTAHKTLEVEFEHRITSLVALGVELEQRTALDQRGGGAD